MLRGHIPENENYHLQWDYRLNGLTFLITSQTVRNIALIFLWLFSPLYVWEIVQGFGLPTQVSLALTVAHFLLIFIVKLLFLPVAEQLGLKFGFKGIIFLSSIPFLSFIPLLVFGESFPILLIPAYILWGAHSALFWWGYHGFFIEAGNRKLYGREMSIANVLATIVMILAPILGALIVEFFGFNSLFWFAGAAFLISMVLLLPAKDHKPRVQASTKEILNLFKTHKNVVITYLGYAAEASLISTVWPLFLFLTLGAAINVGQVASGAALIAATLTFGIGFWIDKKRKEERRLLFALGAPLTSLTWVMRSFGTSTPFLIFIDATYRFVEPLLWLPLEVLSYKKGIEGAVNRALLFREYAVSGGSIVITTIITLWLLLGGSLAMTFLIAAVFSLLPLFLLRRR